MIAGFENNGTAMGPLAQTQGRNDLCLSFR
jgi:hypothetical protein